MIAQEASSFQDGKFNSNLNSIFKNQNLETRKVVEQKHEEEDRAIAEKQL